MRVKPWLQLSRLPFLSASIMPFILGTLLAWKLTRSFESPVFFLGLFAVILIQLATHYNAEVYDLAEDALSVKLEKNFFSGGSQVLVDKLLDASVVKKAAYAAIAASLAIGIILQFFLATGKWTLALGASGAAAGFLYSRPPFRLVSRGLGELVIGYGFGLLPIAAGFYLQTRAFHPYIIYTAVPVSLSIINVILANEFPDYPADKLAAKANILVRLGKEKGTFLYAAISFLAIAGFLFSAIYMRSYAALLFYIPAAAGAVKMSAAMLKGAYRQPIYLEKICLYTILINLGTNFAYIAGLLFSTL